MNLRGLYLLMLLALPQPATATTLDGLRGWISQNKVGLATIAAFGGIFLLGSRRAPIAQAPDQELEKIKKDLESKIKADPTRHVARMAIKQRQLLAYRDRQSLLPAIIPMAGDNLNWHLQQAALDCARTHEQYLAEKTQAERDQLELVLVDQARVRRPIALHYYIISPHLNPQFISHNCYPEQYANPENAFRKNETNPRLLFHRELLRGECAIIGFSDGSLQIHIHKTDSQTLENLSDEQHNFIKSLYVQGDVSLTESQQAIFDSLDSGIQANLHRYHRFTTRVSKLKTLIGAAAFLFNVARCAQLYKTDTTWGGPDSASIGNGFGLLCMSMVYLVATAENSQDAWKIPVGYGALVESIHQGPELLTKISSRLKKAFF